LVKRTSGEFNTIGKRARRYDVEDLTLEYLITRNVNPQRTKICIILRPDGTFTIEEV